jgi:hypothetical protein
MSNVEGKWMAKGDEKVGENADNNAGNIQTMKTGHCSSVRCLLLSDIWMVLGILKRKDLMINIWAAK